MIANTHPENSYEMRRVIITINLMFIFYFSHGQTKSLQECVNIAWENNINVQQAKLNIAVSDIDIRQAQQQRYPNLSAGSSLSLSGRSVDPTNNQFAASSFFTNNYSLNSNMLIYNGGILQNNIKRAKLATKSAQLQTDDIKQEIALQVANAYLNVLFSQENVLIEKQRLEITNNQIDQLERLINGGLRPKNDIYELQANKASNEQTLISAEGNLEIAWLQLKQLMRISFDETFDLEVPEIIIAGLDNPFDLSPSKVYEESASRQPALQNSALQVELTEIDKAIANAALLPSLALGGSLGTNYSSLGKIQTGSEQIVVEQDVIINNTMATVGFPQSVPVLEDEPYFDQISDNITYGYGLSLTVPIYTNFRNRANIIKADFAQQNAILTDKNNRDLFRQQIEQAIIDARNAQKRFDAAESSVVAAKKSLDNLQSSFDQGAVDNYQLTIANNQYNSARNQQIIAKYDFIFKMKIIDFYRGKNLNF